MDIMQIVLGTHIISIMTNGFYIVLPPFFRVTLSDLVFIFYY